MGLLLADDEVAAIEAAVAAAERRALSVPAAAPVAAAPLATCHVDVTAAVATVAACSSGNDGGRSGRLAADGGGGDDTSVAGTAVIAAGRPAAAVEKARVEVAVPSPPPATVVLELGLAGRLSAVIHGVLPPATAAAFAAIAAAPPASADVAPPATVAAVAAGYRLTFPATAAAALAAAAAAGGVRLVGLPLWLTAIAPQLVPGYSPPRWWPRPPLHTTAVAATIAGGASSSDPPHASAAGVPPPHPPWTHAVHPAVVDRLLPHQRTAITAGVTRNGRLLLADAMGTGKTATALALAAVYHHPRSPTLIVVPASLRVPWARALPDWMVPADAARSPPVPPPPSSAADAPEPAATGTAAVAAPVSGCSASGQRATAATAAAALAVGTHVLTSAASVAALVAAYKVAAAADARLSPPPPPPPRLRPHCDGGDVSIAQPAPPPPRSPCRPHVAIVSYELAARTAIALASIPWGVAIADEAHELRHAATDRTAAVASLLAVAPVRVLVTGTPALARPADLFVALSLLYHRNSDGQHRDHGGGGDDGDDTDDGVGGRDRDGDGNGDFSTGDGSSPTATAAAADLRIGPHGTWHAYARRYGGPDGRGTWHAAEVHALLAAVMVRRSAKVVGVALPPVTRARVLITNPPPAAVTACTRLTEDVADLRRRLAAARTRGGQGGDTVGVAAIEAKLDTLHRRLGVQTVRAKLGGVTRRLLSLLVGAPPIKVAVFAYHTAMLGTLSAALTARSIRHVTLTGATPSAARAAAVDAFQATAAVRVALLSLRVAGAGLTLTAADLLLFAELPWSVAEAAQAEGRAVRLGRRDAVRVEVVLAPGTADDAAAGVLTRKYAAVAAVVDGQGREGVEEPDLAEGGDPGDGLANDVWRGGGQAIHLAATGETHSRGHSSSERGGARGSSGRGGGDSRDSPRPVPSADGVVRVPRPPLWAPARTAVTPAGPATTAATAVVTTVMPLPPTVAGGRIRVVRRTSVTDAAASVTAVTTAAVAVATAATSATTTTVPATATLAPLPEPASDPIEDAYGGRGDSPPPKPEREGAPSRAAQRGARVCPSRRGGQGGGWGTRGRVKCPRWR
ncbi:hypothetical protein MMPV_009074 [Pyropia vietnamensis]